MANGEAPETKKELKLTPKQKKFADFYVGECNLNAKRAAEMAGYKGNYWTLAATGSENLKKPQIRSYIDARLEAEISPPSEVLTTLSAQMKGSLADLLNEDGQFDLADARKRGVDRILKKVKIIEKLGLDGEVTERRYEYEIHDPQGAADKLAKAHKLYTQKVELTGQDGRPIDIVTAIAIQPVASTIPRPDEPGDD